MCGRYRSFRPHHCDVIYNCTYVRYGTYDASKPAIPSAHMSEQRGGAIDASGELRKVHTPLNGIAKAQGTSYSPVALTEQRSPLPLFFTSLVVAIRIHPYESSIPAHLVPFRILSRKSPFLPSEFFERVLFAKKKTKTRTPPRSNWRGGRVTNCP